MRHSASLALSHRRSGARCAIPTAAFSNVARNRASLSARARRAATCSGIVLNQRGKRRYLRGLGRANRLWIRGFVRTSVFVLFSNFRLAFRTWQRTQPALSQSHTAERVSGQLPLFAVPFCLVGCLTQTGCGTSDELPSVVRFHTDENAIMMSVHEQAL